MDFAEIEAELRDADPMKIVEWGVSHGSKPIATSNFGPYAAVMLHLVTQVKPNIPIIWVDSGYNTPATYLFAEQLIERLSLNLHVYTPTVTVARREAAMGGIPEVDSDEHMEFTDQFKLEPFERAMSEQKPDVWFTGVRSEQTEFRQSMKVVAPGPNRVTKIAPLLPWKTQDMQDYLDRHDLPNVEDYFDPTKASADRECGLHTRL